MKMRAGREVEWVLPPFQGLMVVGRRCPRAHAARLLTGALPGLDGGWASLSEGSRRSAIDWRPSRARWRLGVVVRGLTPLGFPGLRTVGDLLKSQCVAFRRARPEIAICRVSRVPRRLQGADAKVFNGAGCRLGSSPIAVCPPVTCSGVPGLFWLSTCGYLPRFLPQLRRFSLLWSPLTAIIEPGSTPCGSAAAGCCGRWARPTTYGEWGLQSAFELVEGDRHVRTQPAFDLWSLFSGYFCCHCPTGTRG